MYLSKKSIQNQFSTRVVGKGEGVVCVPHTHGQQQELQSEAKRCAKLANFHMHAKQEQEQQQQGG